MKWKRDGALAFTREDGAYTVNRAPQNGWPAAYMLVKRDGLVIVDVERGVTPDTHREAWNRLMEKCDA